MNLRLEITTPESYKAYAPDAPFEVRITSDALVVVDSGAYIGGAWLESVSGEDPEIGFSVNIFRLPREPINVTTNSPLCLNGNVFSEDDDYDSDTLAGFRPGHYKLFVKVLLMVQLNGEWKARELRAEKPVLVLV